MPRPPSPTWAFQGTLLSDTTENTFYIDLKAAGVAFHRRKSVKYLTELTTHLIVGTRQARLRGIMPRTEKLLSAIASGKVTIVSEEFVWKALQSNPVSWPRQDKYEREALAPFYYLAPLPERRARGALFKNKKIAVILTNNERRKSFANIVRSGEGDAMPWTVGHLAKATEKELKSLCLVLVEPALASTPDFIRYLSRVQREALTCTTAAPSYLEELLTSGAGAEPETFDACSSAVVEVHAEFDRGANGADPWHKPSVMGSPTLGVCPKAIQERLNLPPRILNRYNRFPELPPPLMPRPPSPTNPPEDFGYETQDTPPMLGQSMSPYLSSPPLSAHLVTSFTSLHGCSPKESVATQTPKAPSRDPRLLNRNKISRLTPDFGRLNGGESSSQQSREISQRQEQYWQSPLPVEPQTIPVHYWASPSQYLQSPSRVNVEPENQSWNPRNPNPLDELIRKSCVAAVQKDPINTPSPIFTQFCLSQKGKDEIDSFVATLRKASDVAQNKFQFPAVVPDVPRSHPRENEPIMEVDDETEMFLRQKAEEAKAADERKRRATPAASLSRVETVSLISSSEEDPAAEKLVNSILASNNTGYEKKKKDKKRKSRHIEGETKQQRKERRRKRKHSEGEEVVELQTLQSRNSNLIILD